MLHHLKFIFLKIIDFLKIERKYFPVFLFLVSLSTLFWVLTVLSKEYTSVVSYNVKFVDLPEKKMIAEEKKVNLQLQVIAPGFTILAHKLMFQPDIELSVSGFIPQKKGKLWNYFWLGKQSLSEVQDLLPTKMQLLHIQPNRIDLLLDEKSERTVNVKLVSDFKFEPMFRQKGEVILNPSSITISGPREIVNLIDEVDTELVSYSNINSDIEQSVSLAPINLLDITSSENIINWKLEVEQFTEGNITLPIKCKNIPKGYFVKLFPDNVRLEYLVSLNNFDFIKPSSFNVSVTMNQEYNRLDVQLDEKSDFVENVRIIPSKVEYVLIKDN